MVTSVGRNLTYRDAINEALLQELARDPDIIIMGEDIAGGAAREHLGIIDAWGGPFGTTRGLIKEFGATRVRDTPISEEAIVGAAIGAAMTGLRPVVDLMLVDFAGLCMDQLQNNAAKLRYMTGGSARVPLTIVTRIGAGVGEAAQHSGSFYSIFAHIPGLKVVAPSDSYTAKGLLMSAIRDDDPVIYLEHKLLYPTTGDVPEEPYTVPIGEARLLRPGNHVTLVGISRMTSICLEAAATLAEEGIDAEVIDLLSLSPIDYDLVLGSVRKTHRLIVVDEDTPRCGIAAEILAKVAEEAFDYLDGPPRRVTAPHTPVPHSRRLESAYIPTAMDVISAVRDEGSSM